MSPSVPERVLPSVPITSTEPGGDSSIAVRCAFGGSLGLGGVVVLAARDVAQRIGRPDDPRRRRIERLHAIHRDVTKPALQRLHRDGRRARIQEVFDLGADGSSLVLAISIATPILSSRGEAEYSWS